MGDRPVNDVPKSELVHARTRAGLAYCGRRSNQLQTGRAPVTCRDCNAALAADGVRR